MTMYVIRLSQTSLASVLILILTVTNYATAARPNLILDDSRRVLTVQYLPRLSGPIHVLVYLEDDRKRHTIGSRELEALRGQRFSTEFSISVVSNCIYIVEVIEQDTKAIEVKNLYRARDRTSSKVQQISEILSIPLNLAGEFLDKATSILLSPMGKNLFRVDSDGSNLQKLTSFGEGTIAFPRISPDGSAVAFVRSSDAGRTEEIWVLRYGGKPVQVTTGRSPTWSADGQLLLYLKHGRLYELHLVGEASRERPITDGEPLEEILGWTRNGSGQLLVTSRLGSEFRQVWRLQVTPGERTRLPYDSAYLWLPYLSPSGTHLVFSEYSGAGGKSHIYLQEIGGSKLQLTHDAYDDDSPSWSPDGKTIVFVSERP